MAPGKSGWPGDKNSPTLQAREGRTGETQRYGGEVQGAGVKGCRGAVQGTRGEEGPGRHTLLCSLRLAVKPCPKH